MKIKKRHFGFLVLFFTIVAIVLNSCADTYNNTPAEAAVQQKDSITVWIAQAKDTISPVRETLLNKAYEATLKVSQDSIKAKYLVDLSYEYSKITDTATFRKVNKEAIALTAKSKDSSGLAAAYWDLGDYYSNRIYKKDSAYYYYAKAQRLYEKTRDDFSSARMLLNMAVEQVNIKDYTGSEINTVKAIMLLKPLKKYRQLYSCYNNLGIIFDELEDYEKALDYYSQALTYLKKINRRNILEPIALNNIGVAYKNQGKYAKAIEKYKEAQRKNDAYAKDPQFKAAIIDNIAYARFKMGDTTELPEMFYEALQIRDSLHIIPGISVNKLHLAEYYVTYKDTVNALQNANEARELAASSKNFEDLLASLFLLSKLEKPEKGITYLYDYIKLSDSLHMEERQLREKFTRIKFETDELIIKNWRIERVSELQKWIIGICLFLILISGVAILYYYRKQQMYRIRFKALLNKKDEEKEKTKTGATTVAALDISEKALNNITEKLKTFIEEKQFLSNTVSLNELAKSMDTNPNYLSRFINFYEQKNFSAYIKDLRINYAVAELKTNAIFRKYSIKAIAEELGFNNEQSFSKAFYKKTGIYPSYFIKELEKEVLRKRSA